MVKSSGRGERLILLIEVSRAAIFEDLDLLHLTNNTRLYQETDME